MLVLAITTSTAHAGVAIVRDDEVLAEAGSDDIFTHAERLFGLIDQALSEAGCRKHDVTLVACDIGPGSFTGVRVGLASAKGIALGLSLPLIGVGSLAAMAEAVGAPEGTPVVAALDAKKQELFVGVSKARGAPMEHVAHVPISEIAAWRDRAIGLGSWALAAGSALEREAFVGAAALGEAPSSGDQLVEHLGLRIAGGVLRPKPLVEHLGLRNAGGVLRPKPLVAPPRAAWIARIAREKALRGEVMPAADVVPSYVRPAL